MKLKFPKNKLIVDALIAVVILMLFALNMPLVTSDSAATSAVNGFSIAPVNPAYADYMNKTKAPGIVSSVPVTNGSPAYTGYIPVPFSRQVSDTSPAGHAPLTAYAAAYPSHYDLRTLNRVTPVKNQGPAGTCWAFAATGAVESYLMPGQEYNFSENNLKNTAGYLVDPNNGGGNELMSTAYYVRGSGPVNASDDPYDPYTTVSPAGLKAVKNVTNVIYPANRVNALDNNAIKYYVTNYGALQTSMYWAGFSYFNNTTNGYFLNGLPWGYGMSNHAVEIVGWDDNYSRYNFTSVPAGNGAFLIRNSWGTDFGDGGYFWVSYYESDIGMNMAMYIPARNSAYDHLYQYDPLGWVLAGGSGITAYEIYGANVFTAKSFENLTSVGFYTTDPYGSSYEVRIYANPTNGTPLPSPEPGKTAIDSYVAIKNGSTKTSGYYTVSLSNPVPLTPGENYTVLVKLDNVAYYWPLAVEASVPGYSSIKAVYGQSYASFDGAQTWSDLADPSNANGVVACIKAYTRDVRMGGLKAKIDRYDVPSTMVAGQNYTIRVTVNNTGTQNWTQGFELAANSMDTRLFGNQGVSIPVNTVVAPGYNYTFNIPVTAPLLPDSYALSYRMTTGTQNFGSTANATVNVMPMAYNSTVVSDGIPSTMANGTTYNVSLVLNNTGNVNWGTSDVQLGAIGRYSGNACKFGAIRFNLTDRVAPGTNGVVSFSMTAPSRAGTYNVSYRLLSNNEDQWFGAYVNTTITVK